MGVGAGILLIAVGAILTFARHATVAGVDLRVVGWALMLTGVAGFGLSFVFWNRRRAMHPRRGATLGLRRHHTSGAGGLVVKLVLLHR